MEIHVKVLVLLFLKDLSFLPTDIAKLKYDVYIYISMFSFDSISL